MDPATLQGFVNERDRLSQQLSLTEQACARELETALPDWREANAGLERFCALTRVFHDRFERSTFFNITKFVIVDLMLGLEAAIATRDIPDEVLAMYPDAASRLLVYVRNCSNDYSLPNDHYLKDLRFASGLGVPCGAQVVDLRSMIGYRASARWLLRNPSRHYTRSILRFGQIGPWFRVHTESRYLDEFNEPGWDACYLRIATLLRRHREVIGMAGTSWFYDPQLETVSPRLSYLRTRPLERGASIVWSGTTAFDIRSATAKSESRRRLYEEGKYIPVSYTLLWPREKLLAWADTQVGKRL